MFTSAFMFILNGSFPIMLPLCNPVIPPLAVSCFRTDAPFDTNEHVAMLRPDAPWNDRLQSAVVLQTYILTYIMYGAIMFRVNNHRTFAYKTIAL